MPGLLAALLVVWGVAASVRAEQDDLEKVRLATLAEFCWPAASALPTVVAQARAWASTLNASGLWPDINYNDPGDRANWQTLTHLDRVQSMAAALATPGSTAFEQPALSSATHLALGAWLEHRFTNENWWFSKIGIPLLCGCTFLMLGENRTSAAEQAGLISISLDADWWNNAWGGGANLVWMIQAELYRGLATRNVTAVKQGFDTMWADVTMKHPSVSGQEGIYPDGIYAFHGHETQNYAYGADWVLDILQFHTAAKGTAYDLPPAAMDILASFLYNGDAHTSFGNYFDFALTGRGIDRPGSSFAVPFSPASIRSVANQTTSPELRAGLQAWAALLAGSPDAVPLVGARMYWTSDYATIHRPRWGASIKAHGTNGNWTVVGGECDNSEDILAEHAADGVLSLYGDLMHPGAEYVTPAGNTNAVFPLWDWQGINGITVEHSVPLEPCGAGDVWPVINTEFVGGVSDGLYLAFAMDTATHHLTAVRSWLFFDGAILALAANISDTQPVNVQTALASRLLPPAAAGGNVALHFANGSSTAALPDGTYAWPAGEVAWAWAGGNGIVPAALGAAGANTAGFGLSVGTRSANWSSIGAFSGVSTNRLLAAHLDHSDPTGGGSRTGAAAVAYAYVLLPATPLADMPAAAADLAGLDRACITNSAAVQGASHPAAGVAQIIFWAAGSYSCASTSVPGWSLTVASDGPAIVLVRDIPGAVAVSAAHPTANSGAAAITISRKVAAGSPGCAPVGAGSETLVTIPYPTDVDYRGSTVSVTCAV